MCGIVGYVSTNVERENFLEGLYSLRDRGPDDTSFLMKPGVGLGNTRLAIQGVRGVEGRQPFQSQLIPSVYGVLNGEIVNKLELRKQLRSAGHAVIGDSDTEVLLAGWAEWGESVVEHIEGMFSFAITDYSEKRVFLARDPVGQKPLYVTSNTENGLVFGSSPESVLAISGLNRESNLRATAHMMTLGYVPYPYSMWMGIDAFPPGHTASYRLGNRKLRPRRYWSLPPLRSGIDHLDVSEFEQFPEIFREYLTSDVPVSLALSGGIDSSFLLTEMLPGVEKTFSLRIETDTHDESNLAAKTSAFLGVPNEVAELSQDEIPTLLDRVSKAAHAPQGFSSLLSWKKMSETAADEYKVLISGDGGDESLGGYRWYFGRLLEPNILDRTRAALRSRPIERFRRKSTLNHHAMNLFPRFLPMEVNQALGLAGQNAFTEEEMIEPLRRHFDGSLPLGDSLRRVDLLSFCGQHSCQKTDQMSMSNGLEVRAPLLDRRFLDWAMAIPFSALTRQGPKSIISRRLQEHGMTWLEGRPKKGFSTRISSETISKLISSVGGFEGVFDAEWQRRAISTHGPLAKKFIVLAALNWFKIRHQ